MKKKIPFLIFTRWNVSFFFSLLFHLLLIFFLYQKYLAEQKEFQEIALVEKEDNYFLIDLKNPQYQESKEKRVISLYNYEGLGRLFQSPTKQQHVAGNFNPQVNNNSTSYALKNFSASFEKEKLIKENSERITEKNEGKLAKKKQEAQAEKKENSAVLGIETKNSLEVHFWYDKNNQLQVSATAKATKFDEEFKNIITERVKSFIHSGGALNYHYIKTDRIRSLGSVSSEGIMRFEKVILLSSTQPYFNYLAGKAIPQIYQLNNLPPKLPASSKKKYFLLTIEFQERPLKRWTMGWRFL